MSVNHASESARTFRSQLRSRDGGSGSPPTHRSRVTAAQYRHLFDQSTHKSIHSVVMTSLLITRGRASWIIGSTKKPSFLHCKEWICRNMTDSVRKPPPESLKQPELSHSEMELRQKLLARATLAETAGVKRVGSGRSSTKPVIQESNAPSPVIIPDAVRDMVLRKRQEIADAAARKAVEQPSAESQVDLPAVQKSKETPLLEVLRERLLLGPMPVSEYVGLALSHPKYGYYTTRKVFGPGGDFVTAPEISQVRPMPFSHRVNLSLRLPFSYRIVLGNPTILTPIPVSRTILPYPPFWASSDYIPVFLAPFHSEVLAPSHPSILQFSRPLRPSILRFSCRGRIPPHSHPGALPVPALAMSSFPIRHHLFARSHYFIFSRSH
jgi:hypothetical protein